MLEFALDLTRRSCIRVNSEEYGAVPDRYRMLGAAVHVAMGFNAAEDLVGKPVVACLLLNATAPEPHVVFANGAFHP